MVKQRKASTKRPTQSLEEFANNVEGQGSQAKPWENLDPDAPRYNRNGKGNPNTKTLTFPMNEYEHVRLQAACKAADRGMLDFVRLAVKAAVAKELEQ